MHAVKIMRIFNRSENYETKLESRPLSDQRIPYLLEKKNIFVSFQQMRFMGNGIRCGRRLHVVGHIYVSVGKELVSIICAVHMRAPNWW